MTNRVKAKWLTGTLSLALAAAVVSGCTQSAPEAGKEGIDAKKESAVSTAPVTLSMLQYGSGISDQEFQEIIAGPVKKKYPHITMELRKLNSGETLETLITSGTIPDMVFSGILDVADFKALGLEYDLSPLIPKHQMDLSAFDPVTVEMVKKYGDKGQIYAMPFSLGFPLMYYNKDIFDKFAVPYPKESMTWEEMTALAKQVTKNVDGVQYKGFAASPIARLSLTMLQPKVDMSTGKAALTTDGWKQTMEIFKEFKTIPGNDVANGWKEFTQDRTVAMYSGYNGEMAQLEELHKAGKGFNWDVAATPTTASAKGKVDTPLQVLIITSQSKNKDAAFLAMKALTDKEAQLQMSKAARPPVLADAEVKKVFGENFASLKGKNIQIVFKYKHEPINVRTPYDNLVDKEIVTAGQEIIKGKDVNTAMREAQERANQAIEAYKASKK